MRLFAAWKIFPSEMKLSRRSFSLGLKHVQGSSSAAEGFVVL